MRIHPDPGKRATRPREGALRRPPFAELDGNAPSLVGDTEDYCGGGGRGIVVRPRPVWWRSREPVVRGTS